MKLLFKIIIGFFLVYLLFWGGVAAYFSYADRHKGLLESNLSSMFERDVSIDNVETVWQGFSPRLKIEGFEVEGDTPGQPALAFSSLSAVVSPVSILTLWPRFTEFAFEKPVIEIVSLENNQLQIAGLNLAGNRRGVGINQRLISWLLDHQSASWVDGQVIWRSDDKRLHRYQNINIDFSRASQSRVYSASVITPKGPLAFTAITNGDLIADSQWDASLEVEGESGESLLTPKDFSVKVEDGRGRLDLKTLDVERIRDFIKLTGLAGEAGWLLDAKLTGRLHDVHLDFSGPLLNIETWSLKAAASDIGFKSVGPAPAMNNLNGELQASASGGNFIFATRHSEFSWSRLYDQSFMINRAMGEFSWEVGALGELNISVLNAEFEDKNTRISDIHATVKIDTAARKVSNFGQLFKVDSVADLSYSAGGELLDVGRSGTEQPRITVDANAEFEVYEVNKLAGYLPNNPKLRNFRKWSKNAFLSGQITNGLIAYKGEVSSDAFDQGKAYLDASADFADVTVDYAPAQNWPAAKRSVGSATLKNGLLTISPSEIWLNGDPLSDAELKISSLFKVDRALSVRGKTTTSLVKGMDFLFKGPLIKPENRSESLPLVTTSGWVDIETQVDMVLNDVVNTRVHGTAEVRNGSGVLTDGVPVDEINASVVFTERKVESDNVRATFLGGETRGKVITVTEAQPPVVKLLANGVVKSEALKPWVGEHVLTWLNGEAPWQGSILFDGDRVEVQSVSNLEGIGITAPAPLKKAAEESSNWNFSMVFGGRDTEQFMSLEYGDLMGAYFQSNKPQSNQFKAPSLFDNTLIKINTEKTPRAGSEVALKPGVNFSIAGDINLDEWLSAIIDLAEFEPEEPTDNTEFLDAMRSVNIVANNPIFLDREFGPIDATAVSVDGLHWIGTLSGENIGGTMQMQPRAAISNYGFSLSHLFVSEEPNPGQIPENIDYSLDPSSFPSFSLEVENFRFADKNLGSLSLTSKPDGERWLVDRFELKHNGISTTANGSWVNNKEFGSISNFSFNTVIDEAEGALNEMDFEGVIKKGKGTVNGSLRWIGAPHEFEYGRLNGDFDAFIKDGELVQIDTGGVNLLGLLNFNAIARRLIFDFSDVFASGLEFDRMRYAGAFADGEAILSEAFVLAPAVFVRMEGKIDINKELVDLEVHVSPELGGNIALLSALANPAAGAFVFITQRIFKDEMRNSSFKSYRALGSWEDFEMVEIKGSPSSLAKTAAKTNISTQEPEIKSNIVEIPPDTEQRASQGVESLQSNPKQ
jgi:uncharacterized protein YhdP